MLDNNTASRDIVVLSDTKQWELASKFHLDYAKNHLLSEKVLEYEYGKNPDKFSSLIALVDKSSNIIASLGAIGFSLRQGNKHFNTVMLERLLIAPEHRAQGNFPILEDILSKHAYAEGVSLIWGISPVYNLFARIKYWAFEDITDCLLLSESIKCNRLNTKIKAQIGYTKDLFSLSNQIAYNNPNTFFLDYTHQKVNWLISKNPYVNRFIVSYYDEAKLIGFSVLRVTERNALRIDDLMVIDLNYLEGVLKSILKEAKRRGLAAVAFYGNENNKIISKIMSKMLFMGFQKNPLGAKVIMKKDNEGYRDLYLTGVLAPAFWAN